jgi:hypothetical protein
MPPRSWRASGRDGGWAEGIFYGKNYNTYYIGALEALRTIGLDLWQRPPFCSVRRFFFYCSTPNAEFRPYGDGVAVLVYHGIGGTTDAEGRFTLSVSRFGEQLAMMRAAVSLAPPAAKPTSMVMDRDGKSVCAAAAPAKSSAAAISRRFMGSPRDGCRGRKSRIRLYTAMVQCQ